MVENTSSAERMSLSLFLSMGREGSVGPRSEEGVRLLFPSCLGGRFGGFWAFAFSFLPTAFLTRLPTTSTVFVLTWTALPLTMWAWVKAERVLGLLITIPLRG